MYVTSPDLILACGVNPRSHINAVNKEIKGDHILRAYTAGETQIPHTYLVVISGSPFQDYPKIKQVKIEIA